MQHITRVAAASLFSLSAAFAASAQENSENFELSPCFIDGVSERVSCAAVDVPLDYDSSDGVQISVHVAIIPATSSSPAADPLFVFAGGPGQAAGEYGPLAELAFYDIRKNRDIVLIDQRGTGKSYGLRCSYDDVEDIMIAPEEAARRCRAEHDIDVRHFTLENIMRDVDGIREKLGYEQVNLWGASYGTKSVSLFLKRYPERVRSVIVDGVVAPDQSLFLSAPASAERALTKLVDDCKSQDACYSAYPNFKSQIHELVAKAERKELVFKGNDPISGEYLELELEPAVVIESIRASMYNAEATTILPYVVNEAHSGNLTPMVAALLNGTAVADSMYLGATMSLLCGEDVSNITPEAAAKAGEGSFAGDSYYKVWSGYCSGWDYIRPTTSDFFAPVDSSVPALVLSGDLDPVTPPPLGEHWMKGLPNGRHIVVEGTGHNTSFVGCMPELMAEFLETLDAGSLDTSCFAHLDRLPLIVSANGNVK